jgi:hypothetical protein
MMRVVAYTSSRARHCAIQAPCWLLPVRPRAARFGGTTVAWLATVARALRHQMRAKVGGPE